MSDQPNQPAAGQQQQAAPPPAPPAPPSPPASNGGKETVTDRIKRAKRTAVNALLTELGHDSVDSLRAALQAVNTSQSAIEAESNKVKALEGEKTALQQQIDQFKADQLNGKIDGAIKAAVSTPQIKAQYPEDVVKFIRTEPALADEFKATFNDKGEADATKLAALIEKVKKERPAWFGSFGAGSPSNRNGKALDPAAASKDAARRASMTNQRIIRG